MSINKAHTQGCEWREEERDGLVGGGGSVLSIIETIIQECP